MLKDWRQTPATRWVLTEGPRAGSHLGFLVELCAWLCRRRLPLYQVNQYTPTLHPLMQGVECVWHRTGRAPEEVQLHWRGGDDLRAWHANPLRQIMLGTDEIRIDLAAPAAGRAAPILDQLRAEGASEYLVMAVPLADGRRNAISFATDAPGGFTLAARSELRNLAGPLGLVLDLLESRRTARTLLDTYLGRGPGREVLSGAIRRGDRRDLEAVILFADLRDFTAKSASWTIEELLAALDTFYQALVDAITVAGGEVLKFMGDGLLAVFPISQPQALARTCQHALAAALAARDALASANRARAAAEALEFGVALHVGPVVYGNIGGQGRLDFTVIGPAVNLVSRVEGLCKTLASRCSRPRRSRARSATSWSAPASTGCAAWRKPSSCSACPKRWRRPRGRRRLAGSVAEDRDGYGVEPRPRGGDAGARRARPERGPAPGHDPARGQGPGLAGGGGEPARPRRRASAGQCAGPGSARARVVFGPRSSTGWRSMASASRRWRAGSSWSPGSPIRSASRSPAGHARTVSISRACGCRSA